MAEHFYKFKGKLNKKLVKLKIEIQKIKQLRKQFLKVNGLIDDGMI